MDEYLALDAQQKQLNEEFTAKHDALAADKAEFERKYTANLKIGAKKRTPSWASYQNGVKGLNGLKLEMADYQRSYKNYVSQYDSLQKSKRKIEFSPEEKEIILQNTDTRAMPLYDPDSKSMRSSQVGFLSQFGRIDKNIKTFRGEMQASETEPVKEGKVSFMVDAKDATTRGEVLEVAQVNPLGGVEGANQLGTSGRAKEAVLKDGELLSGNLESSLSMEQVNTVKRSSSQPLVTPMTMATPVTNSEADFPGSGAKAGQRGEAILPEANRGGESVGMKTYKKRYSGLEPPETTMEDVKRRSQKGGMSLRNSMMRPHHDRTHPSTNHEDTARRSDAARFNKGELKLTHHRPLTETDQLEADMATDGYFTTAADPVPVQDPVSVTADERTVTDAPMDYGVSLQLDELVSRDELEGGPTPNFGAAAFQLQSNAERLSIDKLKLGIETFHALYDDVIPELKDKAHQAEKAKALKSKNVKEVRKHFLKMEMLVKAYLASLGGGLSVGVIISAADFMNTYSDMAGNSVTVPTRPPPPSTDDELVQEVINENPPSSIGEEGGGGRNAGVGRKDDTRGDGGRRISSVNAAPQSAQQRRLGGLSDRFDSMSNETPTETRHFSHDSRFATHESKHVSSLRGTSGFDTPNEIHTLVRNGGIRSRFSHGIKGKEITAIIPTTEVGKISNPTLRQDVRQPQYVRRPVIQRNASEFVIKG